MEKNCHAVLEQKMCKELEMIMNKYDQNPSQEMTVQDLEKVDKLYHALKCMATYSAMKEADEAEYSDQPPVSNEYTNGYSRGYAEAMNHVNGIGYQHKRW